MIKIISTPARRGLLAIFTFIVTLSGIVAYIPQSPVSGIFDLDMGQIVYKLLLTPSVAAIATFFLLSACANPLPPTLDQPSTEKAANTPPPAYLAQVVGVQWMNPLHRRDYSTEWQLLWTLGLAKPNVDDDKARAKPKKFLTLQAISPIAFGNNGTTSFNAFHEQYFDSLTVLLHDIYFSNPKYFYNAHSLKDHSTWRELAGIHVEYALPNEKLDTIQATHYARDRIRKTFSIGNPNFPNAWSKDTPPDVRVTVGGPNAGFSSLSSAIKYLETHPDETVWAMNWDAPNYPSKDEQTNENIVLLVLAGPNYKTEREPLAWLGYPATHNVADFEKKSNYPSRVVQAWQATLQKAVANAGKELIDIGYVIHDANNTHAESSERIGNLAHITSTRIAEFDFMKQSFNTSALLGDMGAGTALTDVALGIAYANHMGKNVLIAGTTELDKPTAVVVVPPAKVRPIDHDKPWFRARGENNAYLMWWGLRHDAEPGMQGYSK